MKEQAQELLDLGNSKEKAEGYGMMRVIELVEHILEKDILTDKEKIELITKTI
jgi:hypothetical protein